MPLYNTWAHASAISVHLYNVIPQALSVEVCYVFVTTAKITSSKCLEIPKTVLKRQMASVFLKPQHLNSGKTLVPVTHMRHKKPRAIVAILITKHSRYQFIFRLNFWAAFPLLLFQALKNQLGHIDACFNFKIITEAMTYTSSAEKTSLSGENLTQYTIQY